MLVGNHEHSAFVGRWMSGLGITGFLVKVGSFPFFVKCPRSLPSILH